MADANDRVPLRRRRLLELLGSGTAVSVAGCGTDGDDDTQERTTDAEAPALTHAFPATPSSYELNPWAVNYRSGFPSLLYEYPTIQMASGETRASDLLADVSRDGNDVTIRYDDEYQWWNGRPVTARDAWVGHRIDELVGANPRGVAAELVDEYTIQYSFEEPLRREIVLEAVAGTLHNTPAWLFEPWLDRLVRADSASERDEIASDLVGQSITLRDAADRGFGCSPYELVDVAANQVTVERFDGHPDADEIEIPRVRLPVARGMRVDRLINRGALDLGQGVLGRRDRPGEAAPGLEQLARHPSGVGTKLSFNWVSDHLARRNVRRAILSVLPLDAIDRAADWGYPTKLQTGMTPLADEEWLPASVHEQLHRYPVDRNVARASEFMRRAGYERRGDRWISPGGDVTELFLQAPTGGGWSEAAGIIDTVLDEFGFQVQLTSHPPASFLAAVTPSNYEMVTWWTNGSPFDAYDMESESLRTLGFGVDDPDQERRVRGRPVTPTIPSEPGRLRVSGDGRTLNLAELWEELQSPISTERTREIVGLFARWWNFALPDLHLASTDVGVWGDTREYDWPEEGSARYRTAGPNGRIDYHLLQTGSIQPSE